MIGIADVMRGDDRCDLHPNKDNKITVAVEGNIGSGKTTLLKYFRQNSLVEVIEEPVKKWQNIGGQNLLNLFYEDCKRWSYLFESYFLLTLMQVHKKPHTKPIKMIERSVYSGYYCFENNLCVSGLMTGLEHSAHNHWFDWITKQEKPDLDLIIYLRTSPEKCMERVKMRHRDEETSVSMDLLNALHERHESWLIREEHPLPAPVLVVDGNKTLDEMYKYYDTNCDSLLGINPIYQSPQGLKVQ
ncbi:thymidine kinase 2, mitochondrial-like [Actinia tenebrosa]|uniref:Thymidine kinase 2, mitochondrial-like n=1 Tax=Actinia tenebrosa TaxID=6105 RepID=A0A6P8I5V3_ACTTE|nr:thymidine kinase 2, mitochondrial-like [Actinia tenebrosa]XP_031563959.1 thymidine kinase 2, mitochondrial-like [Actinia tenebrosa]